MNMTTKQKAWSFIFTAMFALPEILWSPIINYIYELSQTSHSGGTHPYRYNFLQHPDNINLLSTVLFIQFLGLTLTLISLIVLNLKLKKWYLWALAFVLLILTIIAFFVFGLSISLRSIGF